MVSTKVAIISLSIGMLMGLKFSKIYIPEDFERPYSYRGMYVLMETVGFLARLGESLGYGHEAANIRNTLDYLNGIVKFKDDNIIIEDTSIENVKVRIFKPKRSTEEKLPAILYFHGGAYYLRNFDSYSTYLAQLVDSLNLVIISVDYKLAPEFPYPAAVEDGYIVAKYLVQNPEKYSIDLNRLIVGGDSAGGNLAAVLTLRLIEENIHKPKLQVLIYPSTQRAYSQLPSIIRYQKDDFVRASGVTSVKSTSWYLGIDQITPELADILDKNEHFALLQDQSEQERILSYLDVSQIPSIYKNDSSFYDTNSPQTVRYFDDLPDNHLLKRNAQIARKLRLLFDQSISPLFAPEENIKQLPKTYMLIFDWDALKDEGLLYAERLKKAGVEVKVDFTDMAFHGMASITHKLFGYKKAITMQANLINYLKSNI